MSDLNTPAADGDAGAREGFDTVADAVKEMERREQERKNATRAKTLGERAKGEGSDGQEVDPDPESKRGRKYDDVEDDPEPRRRAKAEADDEDDDEVESDSTDDDVEDDEDDDEDAPRKRQETRQDDDEDDEGDDEDDDADRPLKLRVNGQEVRTTARQVEEFVDKAVAASREVAAEREQLQQMRAQATQQLQAQLAQAQQQAQALAQMAQAMIGQEPGLQLAQTDPQAYVVQKELFQQRQRALQQILQQGQAATQQQQQIQQQQRSEAISREQKAMLQQMPELADPRALAAFQGRVAKIAQLYGYGPQDMGQMFDHRFYVMARDLARLHDMVTAREQGRAKLKNAPVKVPGAQASDKSNDRTSRSRKAAKQQFMKSGRTLRDVQRYLNSSGG